MVITREDGSDTRSTFSQLIGFDEKNKETGASDLTRTDAETADSASLVLETVAQKKNAIGYVSMGALDDVHGVKVLQIDGKTLNAETVQKNLNILRKQRKERGEEIWEEYFIWML